MEPIEYVYASGFKELRNLCPELEQAHQQEWARRFSDDLCSLYVAMTRARFALYMLVAPLQRNKDGRLSSRGYHDNSAAAILRHTFIPPEDIGDDEGRLLFEHGDTQWFTLLPAKTTEKQAPITVDPHTTCKVTIKTQAGGRSLPRIAPSQLEGSGSVRVSDLLALRKSTGQTRGTVIHRLFETVDWLNVDTVLPAREVLTQLLDTERLAYEDEYLDAFTKMLQMPAVIDALACPSDWDEKTCSLWQEKSFAVVMDGRLVQGQLDRVHVWPDHALILDYKTDTPPQEGYDALVNHYRPQLQAYCKAVAAMRKLPMNAVRAKLIFVRDGVVKEV
jgi:ATP-dependent exoDNAse (exonuclease V) beta subunit